MTLAPDAIFRTVLKGIPSAKGKRDGKPVPNHRPFKSLRNNVSRFVLPRLAVIAVAIEKNSLLSKFPSITIRTILESSSQNFANSFNALNCATWDLFIAAKLLELERLGFELRSNKVETLSTVSLTRNEQHGR